MRLAVHRKPPFHRSGSNKTLCGLLRRPCGKTGRVAEGVYRPNVFRSWRRWYLGRLQALVDAYFLVFNQ